ncbi:MAG: UDP-N-acetylmuramoyl-L-alanine--D-glutamate ligase [Bdellovibrionaceae bacterium]|nr:UDP-N-acetylmuramoyl-L-alanine--D-glutamate ligase [Pseudobdellovibrionaceae bacterium]
MGMQLSDLNGKKILIVGFAKTGVALARFLVNHGAEVTVSDHKSKAELANFLEQMDDIQVNYDLGNHTPKVFLQQDLIILSPGISPHLKIFEYAKNNGVQVTGEFEFASRFIKEPVIAVTGTNGKTTTVSLITEMLKRSGVNVWVGGNYGEPLVSYLTSDAKSQVIVVEVSSFMLEHVVEFAPKNIVFMNLAENHLDRHKSMEDYINAKRKIFLNTNQDTTSILNADDNAVVELARDPAVQRGIIYYFSRKQSLEPQIMNIGGGVQIRDEIKIRTGPDIEVFSVENMKMRGFHNVENTMAAILASREHGATHEAIQDVIDTYTGIEHRLEYVRKVGGVEFYNDSKATNVHAVLRALKAFDENVILIMGGKDTGLNYAPLREEVRRKVKTLILVGEAKERINRDIGDHSETFLIGTFDEAVHMAYSKSRIGDKVLLSPGASSFDFFDDYRDRGNYFKQIVHALK